MKLGIDMPPCCQAGRSVKTETFSKIIREHQQKKFCYAQKILAVKGVSGSGGEWEGWGGSGWGWG